MTYGPTVWVDYGVPCINAANLNNMEAGIDRAQGDVMVLRDVTANIPASDPLLVGRLYIETDLLERIWRDNGAGWDLVPTGGGVWVYIAETVLGAPAATVTFAAIPGTYRSLYLIVQVRSDLVGPDDSVLWRANADAGNNYNWLHFYLTDNDDVGAATRATNAGRLSNCETASSRANNFTSMEAQWHGYALNDREKNCLGDGGVIRDLSADNDIRRNLAYSTWQNTAPITSLTYLPGVGANFVTGCRFTLYGIT